MTKQLYTCDVDVESNILMYQHHFTPQQPNHEIGNSNQLIFTQDLKPVEEVASNSTKKIKKSSSSKNKSSSSKKKKSSSSKLSWSQDNDEPHSQMLDPEAMKKTSSSILITKSQPLTQTNNMLTTQTDSFGASMSGASLLLPSRISYYNITQSKQDEENQAPNPSRDQCEEAPTFLFNRKTELSKRKKWSYGLVDAERKLSAAAANNDNNTTTSSSNKTSLPLLTMGTSLSNNNSAVADDDELNNDDSEISSSTSIGTSIRSSLGSFSSQNNISGGEIVDNHSLSQHLVHHKLPESVTSISSASSSSSASVAKPGGVGGSTSLSFPSQDHQSPSRHHYVKKRAVHASISSSSSLSESSVTNISNYSSGQANDDKRATLQQSQQYRSSTKQPQPQNTSVKAFSNTNNYQSQYQNNYQQQINANLIENATYGTVMTHRSKRNHSTSAYHQHKSSSNHAPMAIMTRTTSSRPLKESSSSHHKSSSKHHSSKHSKESRSSRKALERIERIELANNNSRNVLYGPSRDDDDADDVSWKMKEIIMQKQREKLNNYLRLQQNQLIAQQQHQAHDRFRSHHNVRKSSLNLSTSSSSSSFSSALSEQSAAMSSAYQNNNIIQHQQQQQQQQPPFLQSSIKPIALSYYHHLYNEKLMNSVRLHGKSSRRGVSTLQPALYKTTYVHHNQHQQSPNELFNSPHHNMFMNLMNHNAPTTKSFKKEFSKKSSGRLTNTNSTNTNNTNNLNYSSTSTNGSGESIGSNYSLNNASNDIKHVKFRNYGLHKSLGENLNKITSTVATTTTPSNSLIPTLAPSAAALKTHNQSPHNRQHSVTPTPTSTTQLTPSSKSNRRSCNTATSNMSNRRRSPQTPSPMTYHRHPQHRSTPNRPTSKSINNIVAYDDEEDEEDEEDINGERIYVNNRHYRTNSGHVTTSTSSGCGGDLLSDFVIRSNLQNQHDETPIATPTHKRRRELFEMPFKSCSPPRRRRGHFDADGESNAHYYNNHHSAEKTIGRAVSTFDNRCKYGVRSSRYEAPELITFIQSRLTNSRTEENDKSKFHIDFLNNSYETIFSTRTELVNKPIQMSIDTKNSGGGVVTAEIKLDDEPIKFDLVKMDDTRYELRLVPNRCGIYQVHMYLNMQPIKGSPFLIKIDSNGQVQAQPALNTTAGTNDYSSNTTTQITQISSLATSSNNLTSFTTTTSSSATPLIQPSRTPQQQQKSPRKKSSDSSSSTARSVRLIRTELFDLTNQSDDLIAGEEVKLNVKILEYGSNDKLKKTISNIETKVKHNDKFISHKLELLPNGIYQIKFLPLKTGPYFVTFYKDGQKIDGSPYRLNIKGKFLKEMNKPNFGQVGVPYILDIEYCNTTNLDVNVSFVGRKATALDPSAQTVPSSPIAFEKSVESDVKLRVKFVPVNMGEHVIDILENGVSIEGFPVRVNVFHNRDAYLLNENVNGTPLGSACKLSVVFDETPKNDIDIKITNLDSGEGQPITFLLNDEYDQIQHVFGAICKFLRIPASRMRNRELAVENGLTRVRFHLIETSKIATSYSKIDDASTTTTTSSSSPNKQPRNSVIIADLREIIENDKFTIIDLSVHKTVRAVRDSLRVSAKGDRINTVSVTKNNNGRRFDIGFIPTVVGRYRLDIDSVPNAPYFINVFDPNGFKIVRRPDVLTLGTENIIEVNLSKCGFANFEAVILSPSGLKLPYKFDSNFAKRIRFIPTESGVHKISMKLGDRILNDHYLEINTRESQVPCVHGAGLFSGIQNVLSTFYVHVPAHIDGNLNIDILDPASNTVKSYLKKLSDTLYEIKYLPMDVGEFKIVINYNDQQIESSPFRAQIVSLERVKMRESYSSSSQSRGDDSGSHFFSLVNNKILDLELEQERVLCFDTTEAGLGDLNVDILAPNNDKFPYRKIVVDPKGIFKIAFTPVYTGQYKIFVGFNNYQLSYSPVIARTLGYSIFNEIKVYGNGICNASLNEQAEFFVDCSRIKEMEECPEISFMGFSDDMNDLKINVTRIEENIYKCNYLPEKPGQYQINIKFNKTHISGSPFQVKIIQNEPPAVPGSSAIGPQISPSTSSSSSASKTDASKIIINKEEVRSAVVNQEIITHIDTRQAGAGGELTATCMGAQRSAQCEFVEQPDTPGVYALKILAHEVGKHVLQIKYNDEHVPGSPFTLRVSTPPDASKVEVFGPGICHGLLENYESKFVCDTRGAGAGQLTVRIRGPKGAFRVDMQRKDEKDRSIICKYDPLESGEYQINVKWSGKHVPNSPFNVHIFKTKEELDKFLAEQQPKEAFRLDEQTTVQNSNATTTSSSAALVNNKTSSSTKNTADNNNSSTTTSKEILVQRI